MDGHGSDGSDDNGTGRGNEWEVLSDLDSSGFAFDSDANNGNGHGALSEGISMVSEHFNCPSLESYPPDDASAHAMSQPVNSSALDWIEPPDSREDSKESFDGSGIGISGRIDDDHDHDVDDHDHDVVEGKHVNVDIKSSLLSPSVQVVLMSTGSAQTCSKNDQNLLQAHEDKGDKYDVEDDAESMAELEREIFAGSGFSSLIRSDMHGNVVRVDEKGHGIGEEEEDDYLGSWWKHSALWRYWRQATTLWSLTLAAAIMGLVILGQRCQHERWKNHQLRLQLCYKDEKISQLLFQIAQLKESSSGRRRIAVIRRNGGLQGHF